MTGMFYGKKSRLTPSLDPDGNNHYKNVMFAFLIRSCNKH